MVAQGIAKSAFIAKAWLGGISIGRPAPVRISARSSLLRDLISDLSCTHVSPPVMEVRSWVRVCVLLLMVFLQASELRTRQALTGIKEIGYTRVEVHKYICTLISETNLCVPVLW